MVRRGAWLVLVAVLKLAGVSSAQVLPPGQILETVTTLGDASQSYALYLPSTYTTDRTWPILVGFHPGARGRAIVDTYRAAAERYGFIVAGSNNSRNGPWDVSMRAVTLLVQDLGQRLAADARRIYLTGHSGGSRVALAIALANPQIAGVIASSAGFPDSQPRSSVAFPIFGTAGTTDFNYIEMRLLERALKSTRRVVIFEGGHTLPPPDVAMQAIEWLELQAMRSGVRPRDEVLIDRFWSEQERAVAAAGETAAAVRLLRAMAGDFRTLRDVKAIERRASELAGRTDIKRALARERDSDDKEMAALDSFARHQSGLTDAAQRMQSLRDLKVLLAEWHTQATAPDDSAERARARRVLRVVTMGTTGGTEDSGLRDLLQQYRLPVQGPAGGTAATAPVAAQAPILSRRPDGLLNAAAPIAGTVVRYTLDGSEPTHDAGVWLAPVEVPPGYELKARAFTPGGSPVGEIVTVDTPLADGMVRTVSTLVPVTQNRDWRTYDWVDRHAAAVALMRERRPEIVMLGDSITHFWGGEPDDGRRTGVGAWERLFAGRRVVNLGYGWDRTENVLWRLTHGEFEGVSPRVVVVMIGTNNVGRNTPDEIAAGIQAICAMIHGRSPSTRILLLAVFPRGEQPNPARDTVDEINRRIAALDGRDGITYLDIGGVFVSADGTIARDVMGDFLHPTAKGYEMWAAAMKPTLERLLAPALAPARD
jgi:lysophospholipase L1-like esterase